MARSSGFDWLPLLGVTGGRAMFCVGCELCCPFLSRVFRDTGLGKWGAEALVQ